MSIEKIIDVNDIETTENKWWFLYDDETKITISEPMQCSGHISSPNILVTGDSEEELLEYIEENGLIVPTEDDTEV